MNVKEAGHELKMNPPKILAKTRAKKGVRVAEAQRRAIMLSKAGASRKSRGKR
jgi:hypothetical protein